MIGDKWVDQNVDLNKIDDLRKIKERKDKSMLILSNCHMQKKSVTV